MELPKYNYERKIGDTGVSIVKDIVENQLNWLLRKVPLEEDFGIDGYIDILQDGKFVTGKSIGVQIKTGNSYFQKSTNSGWIYYGENKHLNYYLNNNNPIIIVIVNPDTKKCYWGEVNVNNVLKTDFSWKIQINRNSELNNKMTLLSIAGTFVDYAPQLEYIAQINKEIQESGLLFIAVDKSDVKQKNYDGIHALRELLTSSDEMIKKTRNKLILSIFGYENDKRELFEISEVRLWMKEVLEIFRYWGYFACMNKEIRQLSTLKTLLFCTIHVKVKRRFKGRKVVEIEHDISEARNFKLKIFEWLNEFTERYNIAESDNFEQSMLILQTIENVSDKDVKELRIKYGYENSSAID